MPAFRVDTFKSNENYAIDASAGTGKTYSIVQIVAKLLKDNKDLSLNEILIVTYTEKAAGELKDRIRAKIKGVDTDNAPISTFHSFCKSTIEEFPFAVNKPASLSLVDITEMEEFAKRYIRESGFCKDIVLAIRYLKENDKKFNEDNLIKALTKACEKYYLDSNGDEDPSVITLEPYRDFATFNFNDINDAIAYDPSIGTHLSVLEGSQDQKSKDLANELKEKFRNFAFDGKKYKRSQKWPTNQAEIAAFDFFFERKEKLKNNKSVYSSLASKYLKDFYIKWREEKIKNNYQTFEDMICTVRESVLMNNSVLLEKLKNKYRYAIIDEFQDTNQKQFDIFKKVFLSDDKHGIIVVGDPKQSIYSFQGADVYAYEKAIEEIESNTKVVGNKNSLDKNYRSTKKMVTSCNEMFSQQGWIFPFSPSNYLSKSDNGDSNEFDVTFEGQPTEAFWISQEENITDAEYAKLVVQQIVDCCTKDANGDTKLRIKDKDSDVPKNVTFKDFTILARTRTEMPPIEKALSKAGIPYVRYKDNGLFKDNECAHWIAVLQAINDPDFTGSRRKIFKKALFTDFFGLSLEEINKKKYNSDKIWQVDAFRKWQNIYAKEQYDTFIESILIDSGLVKSMTNLNDIQKLNKYRQIGDYCSDYLSKKHTLTDLINNLLYLSKGGSSDDEDGAIVQKGTDLECVQIMTIHASKGLQFPIVISIVGSKDYSPNVENYVYHNPNQHDQQTLTFSSNEYTAKERDAEVLRLLYVAYTRAQYIMMLPRYELGSKAVLTKLVKERTTNYIASGSAYRPIALSDKSFEDLSDEVKALLPKATANPDDKNKQDAENKKVIEARKNKQSYKRSYSSLSHPKKNEEAEYDEDENILDKEGIQNEGLSDYDKSSIQIDLAYDNSVEEHKPSHLPKGSDLGSALHEIFEKTNFKQYDKSSVDALTKERFDHYLLTINDDVKQEVFDILDSVLTAKLPVINGGAAKGQFFSLNELDEKDKKPEIEFNTNVLNGRLNNYFNGFIDLLFKRGEYYSVLDWKSDSLNDRDFASYSTKESLKEHTDNAYSIQRVLYCYFLIEWLTLKYDEDRESVFNNHFGGIYYVYLRGCRKDKCNGIYAQTWNSYNDLKKEFDNIIKTLVVGGKKQ